MDKQATSTGERRISEPSTERKPAQPRYVSPLNAWSLKKQRESLKQVFVSHNLNKPSKHQKKITQRMYQYSPKHPL